MKRKFLGIIVTALFLSLPLFVFAAQPWYETIDRPNGSITNILAFANTILEKVIWPAAVFAILISVIWVGFLFLNAKGSPEEIAKARRSLIFAVVGIIVIVLAFSVILSVIAWLGVGQPPQNQGAGGGAQVGGAGGVMAEWVLVAMPLTHNA